VSTGKSITLLGDGSATRPWLPGGATLKRHALGALRTTGKTLSFDSNLQQSGGAFEMAHTHMRTWQAKHSITNMTRDRSGSQLVKQLYKPRTGRVMK
jgi:hypothetical protein